MHGHGYTQPVKQPPPTGWLVFLRVLFVALSFFSIGILAWAMLLRLAIVTRKGIDWGLFVAAFVNVILALVLLGTEPGDEVHTVGGWTGMILLLGGLVAVTAYYLAADVRHFHQLRYGAYAPQPGPAPTPTPAYGYPQAAAPTPSPYTATTMPQTPAASHSPHTPQPSQPPQPPLPTTPPPHRPAPARIDQVRAELDELSDYLRRQDGHHDRHHDGNHEGGR
ncbi:hypothetical protein [Streptomyces sp. NBC_01373]|uniref:hypothetical protein n=1 Tax=Streptomyces sp. NBC_01373 TaxID=2903843 RepID=UPI0022551DC4|nr:hypothetical protein [Streptomyces sp. NBC_01373]MCX4700193.1 hypothetical protein [Streptomyces sp. NBC_01373]